MNDDVDENFTDSAECLSLNQAVDRVEYFTALSLILVAFGLRSHLFGRVSRFLIAQEGSCDCHPLLDVLSEELEPLSMSKYWKEKKRKREMRAAYRSKVSFSPLTLTLIPRDAFHSTKNSVKAKTFQRNFLENPEKCRVSQKRTVPPKIQDSQMERKFLVSYVRKT